MEEKIVLKKKPIYSFLKRFGDILGSLLIIILFSWLYLILALLVKCTSKGPIIYKSQRVGKDGELFTFYKLLYRFVLCL